MKQLDKLLQNQIHISPDEFNHEVNNALLQLCEDNPKFKLKSNDSDFNEDELQQLIDDLQSYDESQYFSMSNPDNALRDNTTSK